LADKSVLDTTTSLVWTNCRATTLIDLEDISKHTTSAGQSTGFSWRLPTEAETKIVEEAEEFYPRPPIMIKVQGQHPFFGTFEKTAWTDQRVRNVKGGDKKVEALRSIDAGMLGAQWSGYARPLGIDPYHMAQEAESLRRAFPLRLVRQATEEDFESSGKL
jgi:hypothetical protein